MLINIPLTQIYPQAQKWMQKKRHALCSRHYFNYLRKLKETMFHILNI